jgi:PEGA domain
MFMKEEKIMKKKLVLFALGVFALWFTSGCATMMSGSTQPVTFKSSPDGVTVTVNGEGLGKTPTILDLKRKSGSVVEFYKEGYAKQTIKLDTRMNGWVLANAIFCFSCVLSTTTDYSTGAAYEYSPNKYFVTLVREGVKETPSDIKRREVRSFIMGNYSSIATDLSRMPVESERSTSKGRNSRGPDSSEYLNTLITMLEIPEPDRQQARDKIKTISSGTKDVFIFAEEIVNSFIP